jgi:hypothetical protein
MVMGRWKSRKDNFVENGRDSPQRLEAMTENKSFIAVMKRYATQKANFQQTLDHH